MCVVDVSGAIAPTLLATFSTGMAASVALVSGFAYVADGNAGVKKFNIARPAAPAPAASFDTPGEAQNIALFGGFILVADTNSLIFLKK